MSLSGRLIRGGMAVMLFTLMFSKPEELSYVTPSLSCCQQPELILLSFSSTRLFPELNRRTYSSFFLILAFSYCDENLWSIFPGDKPIAVFTGVV